MEKKKIKQKQVKKKETKNYRTKERKKKERKEKERKKERFTSDFPSKLIQKKRKNGSLHFFQGGQAFLLCLA